MKSEKEIVEKINQIEADYKHVLDCGPASFTINAPRAAMQITATSILNGLYFVLNKNRPKFKCDNSKLTDQ